MEYLMKTLGIIAEYNPFHNGHAYQIAELKRKTNADFVVIAMSGDFVQRGAPAIIDKYCRAEMALLCGADLVIELPAVWAVSSAEDFAMAGVTLFDKMGCIDGICFGAESDQLPLLKSIAGVLAEEPDIYRSALSSYLKKGPFIVCIALIFGGPALFGWSTTACTRASYRILTSIVMMSVILKQINFTKRASVSASCLR